MSNLNALTNPDIPDRAGLDEFLEDLADLLPSIERIIAQLKRTPGDRELVADLFRGLHNIKGDAGVCQVEIGVILTHPVETLVSRVRAGEIEFDDALAEVILLSMDRLELAVEALAGGRPLAHLKLPALVRDLEHLATAKNKQEVDAYAAQLIETVTGFRPAGTQSMFRPGTSGAIRPAGQITNDLAFFQLLASRLDERSPLFEGRSRRLLRLALETNIAAGKIIDPVQLEAAVYMHDIGMMFLPESAWLKSGKLSAQDITLLRTHTEYATGLLQRMDYWQPAAEMVAQHHEMQSGQGYPKGLKDAEICAGAKVLAIVDAFESIMLKHAHRGQGRSLLRAIAELNACDDQFDPSWIAHFNTVVRNRIE